MSSLQLQPLDVVDVEDGNYKPDEVGRLSLTETFQWLRGRFLNAVAQDAILRGSSNEGKNAKSGSVSATYPLRAAISLAISALSASDNIRAAIGKTTTSSMRICFL